LRQVGVEISPLTHGKVTRIEGRGRLQRPDATLNCGNSGTTTRLLLGLLAAHPMRTTLTGDASLRRRPMRRVTLPLSEMGARFSESLNDGLPLTVNGGELRSLRHQLPVSSAQIKSCLLLAGLAGRVQVELREPTGRSRDHTERLLRAFGYLIDERDGWLTFKPTGEVTPFEMEIPGDPSSAAFPVGAALLAESGELRVSRVCLNPTRTGFLRVLERMGGRVAAEDIGPQFDEPVGALVAGPCPLIGTEVSAEEIPGLIDEIPLLAALATRAQGTTVFRDVAELRVKESNRLDLIASNIRALGGNAEISGDDIFVSGGAQPPRGKVRTGGDHRIAMAFAVLGTVPGARVRIDDMDCAAVSFPGFREMLRSIRR
jgi:3-phosphoshikimate 1-carboxyvinyltransferase